MRGYKILQEKQGYCFLFYPNNSKSFPIGQSPCYESEEKCRKAHREFVSMVIHKGIKEEKKGLAEVITIDSLKYTYAYYQAGEVVFFRKTPYTNKISANNIIKSIYRDLSDYSNIEID